MRREGTPKSPEAEKLRRRQVNESVLGTNAMERLHLDAATVALMRDFEEGELTRQEPPPQSPLDSGHPA